MPLLVSTVSQGNGVRPSVLLCPPLVSIAHRARVPIQEPLAKAHQRQALCAAAALLESIPPIPLLLLMGAKVAQRANGVQQ